MNYIIKMPLQNRGDAACQDISELWTNRTTAKGLLQIHLAIVNAVLSIGGMQQHVRSRMCLWKIIWNKSFDDIPIINNSVPVSPF